MKSKKVNVIYMNEYINKLSLIIKKIEQQNSQGGIYKTIEILTSDKEAQKICDTFKLQKESDISEDIRLINNELFNPIENRIMYNLFGDKMQELVINNINKAPTIIIALSTIIIASLLLFLYREIDQVSNHKRKKPSAKSFKTNYKELENKSNFPITLEVIVSYRDFLNLDESYVFKQQKQISLRGIQDLINESIYFLCTKTSEFEQNNIDSALKDIDRDADSSIQREIYIKINIDKGTKEMIGKPKIKSALRRELNNNIQATVEKIAYLTKLDGLERFNRV